MLLKLLNKILNTAIVLVLLVTALYSFYCIWDNNSIYDAPAELQKELKSQRPDERSPSFEELLKVNPDVAAWVTMEGTQIDDPIVQGEDNQEYREVEDIVGLYLLELRVVERDEETDRHGTGDDYPVPHDINMKNCKRYWIRYRHKTSLPPVI